MTHSNNSTESSWKELMGMYFAVKLGPAESVAWFMELRLTVKGWKHDSLIESDPLKSPEAKAIMAELCDVLRYINSLDHTPRKSEGGKKDYKGKPTLADVQLWVWIYRKNQSKEAGVEVNPLFVEAYKKLIQCFIDKGQVLGAALVATGNPNAAFDADGDTGYADLNRLFEAVSVRSPSEQEANLINDFCAEIGFNQHEAIRQALPESGSASPVDVNHAVKTVVDEWEEDAELFQ